jgi:hypothetical protein
MNHVTGNILLLKRVLMKYENGFIIAFLLFCSYANADTSIFSLRGYGTFGAVRSNEDKADFAGILQPNGVGASRRWDIGVDSKFGLQIDGNYTDKLSSALQVVSTHRYDNTYTPAVEWANLKYQVTPDLNLRIGRVALGTLMVSDFRRIGYANPWVRPPVEVYHQVTSFTSDGADISYTIPMGDITTTLDVAYGKKHENVPGDQYFDSSGSFLSITTEYGPATARIAYTNARFKAYAPYITTLFSNFRQFGAVLGTIPGLQPAAGQAIALADKYDVSSDKAISYLNVGINYDPGRWFITGEYLKRKTDSVYADLSAGYVTAGYRIRNFTPYITFAKVKTDSNITDPGIPGALLPDATLAQTAALLNSQLNGLLQGGSATQTSTSVGLRWDFMKNTSVKLQYDRMRYGGGVWGFGYFQPGFTPGTVHLISASIDFVF